MAVMKRFLFYALTLTLSGCIVPTPKPPQPVWDFSVSVSDPQGQLQEGVHVTFAGLDKTTNDFGWAYYTVQSGCYPIRAEKPHFKPYAPADCVAVDRHKRLAVTLEPDAPPTPRLAAGGKLFTQNGLPWRWKGITAFGLAHRFCAGEDTSDFFTAAAGFNLLRVFLDVGWEGTGWAAPEDDCLHHFLAVAASRGFYVELVLLTGPMPIVDAQARVDHSFALDR